MIRGDSFLHYWGGHVLGFLMIVVGIPWAITAYGLSRAFGWDFETVLFRPVCWITGHKWADRDKWGVEPVCLHCHAYREGEA